MNKKKICKLLKAILNNPKNVRFEDLDKLLRELGYSVRQPKGGSSHYTYFKIEEKMIITVPYKRPFVKSVYVKNVIKLLNLEVIFNEECK